MSIPKYMHTEQKITISSWGMIDDLILYPSDVLVLGEPQDGDLLLVEKKQSSSQRFARFYDGTLIAEPQRAVLSTQIWNIIGAVKAIQRPLDRASLGTKKWWIRVIGREDDSSLDWLEQIEKQPVTVSYLDELGRRLFSYNPTLCIVAAWKPSDLEDYDHVEKGHILFYPRKNELASGFVSTWAKASRREMRRKWMKRRERPDRHSLFFPIPHLGCARQDDKLASK